MLWRTSLHPLAVCIHDTKRALKCPRRQQLVLYKVHKAPMRME